MDKKVKVRFPPSPTGYCHVGTARMALLNYCFAKHHGGTIVFRSEDTDKARSKKEFEDDIIDSFNWIGVSWDEFYRQSERTAIYREHLEKLIAEDKAYLSKEESKTTPGQFVEVVRLRNPGKKITFNDVVRGDITFDTTELADIVIARSIDDPLYHFVVVVDDALMGITHVIRGEDHISNTPRQILIQEAFGFSRPIYAHFSLNLSKDRAKLSKRTGDVAVRLYREQGFLPQALANYLMVVGWTPVSGAEIMELDQMIAEFEIHHIHPSGVVFDMDKLRWMNREHIKRMRDDEVKAAIFERLHAALSKRNITPNENISHALLSILKDRISVWGDIDGMAELGEFDYYFLAPKLDAQQIPNKKTSPEETKEHLEKVVSLLSEIDILSIESANNALMPYATEKGRGAVLWPVRYCLSGMEKSPDPFTLISILGKEESIKRITHALSIL